MCELRNEIHKLFERKPQIHYKVTIVHLSVCCHSLRLHRTNDGQHHCFSLSLVQTVWSQLGSSILRKTARKFLPPFLWTFFPSSVHVPKRLIMTSSTCQNSINTSINSQKLSLVTQKHFKIYSCLLSCQRVTSVDSCHAQI